MASLRCAGPVSLLLGDLANRDEMFLSFGEKSLCLVAGFLYLFVRAKVRQSHCEQDCFGRCGIEVMIFVL